MKFVTHYNFDPAVMLAMEHIDGPSETDGSQNETLSQMIKRFTSQGLVIPPVQFAEETEQDVEEMLQGQRDDITQDGDFDLADASAALVEAQEIIANLRDKKTQADSSTPEVEKTQEEPKLAEKDAEADE